MALAELAMVGDAGLTRNGQIHSIRSTSSLDQRINQMKRCLVTVFPTGEHMNSSPELSSRPDPFRCAAKRVLRRTAQAWVLTPPAGEMAPEIATVGVALSRQPDADRPCR